VLVLGDAYRVADLLYGIPLAARALRLRECAVRGRDRGDWESVLGEVACALRDAPGAGLYAVAVLLGVTERTLDARFDDMSAALALERCDAIVRVFVRDTSSLAALMCEESSERNALFDTLAIALTPRAETVWASLLDWERDLDHEHPGGRVLPPDDQIPGMPPPEDVYYEAVDRQHIRERYMAGIQRAFEERRVSANGRVLFAQETVRAEHHRLHLRLLDDILVKQADDLWLYLQDVGCSAGGAVRTSQVCRLPPVAPVAKDTEMPSTLMGVLCLVYGAGAHLCSGDTGLDTESLTAALRPPRYTGTLPPPAIAVKKTKHASRDVGRTAREMARRLRAQCVTNKGMRVFADAVPGAVEAAVRWRRWWWPSSSGASPVMEPSSDAEQEVVNKRRRYEDIE